MKAEIARFGSEAPRPLTALDTHPSFDCAERNARFGKPGYDLQLALQQRLGALEDAVH
jgi:hypothetical protein